MSRLLRRSSFRHLSRHPWQLGLAILGVTLGVAVVVSIDVANGSAQRAFELSSEAVSGKATHQIEAGGAGLPDELYRRLRVELGIQSAAPVIESYVSPASRGERVLHLLGLDPFAEAPFRSYLDERPSEVVDLAAFLTRPGAALLGEESAVELGLARGDPFAVDVGGAERILTLVGLLRTTSDLRRSALADLLVVDIATAQEMLGLEGRLTRIDLLVPDDPRREAFLAGVRQVLPPDAQLSSAAARSDAAAQMTRAFRLNLHALSLLALLCGAFLIYNTMTFAVVQRRPLLATLRALGTTRREIFGLIVGETLLIGVIGTVAGTLTGLVLGRSLVVLVTQTINDLYFVLSVREVVVPPWTWLKGVSIGLGTTLAAALAPGWEATVTPARAALARSELEARVHRAVPAATAGGVVLVSLGALLILVSGTGLIASLAGLFAVLLGLALLTPLATITLMAGVTPLAGALLGQLGRLATRGVVAALSRTGIAIAALMMALSVTVGVDLMIRSFRSTVIRWLDYSLPADLYISVFTTPGRRFAAAGSTFGPDLTTRLRALPRVDGLNALRHFKTRIDGREARALALEIEPRTRTAFAFQAGNPEALWPAFERGESIFVSEPLAYRARLEPGDLVEVASPAGVTRLAVGGVFYDYSSEQGLVLMHRGLYSRLWSDDRLTAISLHAAPGANLEELAATVRTVLGTADRARVVTNQELRQQSLKVFDRTFLITGVLRTLAVLVAFVSVLSALMALQLERTRELGVLRACGLTPAQLWRLVTQQTGLMGVTAGLLSLPVGVIMASIMVYVINRRSFGWSLTLEIAPATLAEAVMVALVAALLAGVYPSWRMSRTSPAESLRDE